MKVCMCCMKDAVDNPGKGFVSPSSPYGHVGGIGFQQSASQNHIMCVEQRSSLKNAWNMVLVVPMDQHDRIEFFFDAPPISGLLSCTIAEIFGMPNMLHPQRAKWWNASIINDDRMDHRVALEELQNIIKLLLMMIAWDDRSYVGLGCHRSFKGGVPSRSIR